MLRNPTRTDTVAYIAIGVLFIVCGLVGLPALVLTAAHTPTGPHSRVG